MATYYRVLPYNGTADGRNVAEVVNNAMQGKLNCTGSIELGSGEETELFDERIGYESVILFSARAISSFGLPFIKSKEKGKAVIGHPAGSEGVLFDYVVLG